MLPQRLFLLQPGDIEEEARPGIPLPSVGQGYPLPAVGVGLAADRHGRAPDQPTDLPALHSWLRAHRAQAPEDGTALQRLPAVGVAVPRRQGAGGRTAGIAVIGPHLEPAGGGFVQYLYPPAQQGLVGQLAPVVGPQIQRTDG